jgi:hypothetical protein
MEISWGVLVSLPQHSYRLEKPCQTSFSIGNLCFSQAFCLRQGNFFLPLPSTMFSQTTKHTPDFQGSAIFSAGSLLAWDLNSETAALRVTVRIIFANQAGRVNILIYLTAVTALFSPFQAFVVWLASSVGGQSSPS